jgi:hypothetical protein
MSFEDELKAMQEIARRQMARRALGEALEDQGLDVDGDDPLGSVLRDAGLDYGEGELDELYDAILADLDEQKDSQS